MTATASTMVAVKNALYARAQTLYADDSVLVSYGAPASLPDDVVAVMSARATQEPGPLGRGTRSRDEIVEVDVMFSLFRGSGAEAERAVWDRLDYLAAKLEDDVRTTDPSLGGVALWCFLTSLTAEAATDPEVLAKGRLVEAVATFTAHCRISNV